MLYSVALVSAIPQCKSVLIVCVCVYSLPLKPPFPLPSHCTLSQSQAGLPVLHSSCPLAVYFTMIVHICQCYFLNSSHPLPALCSVSSLHLHLHSFPANRLISTIFLDFIYMHYMGYCSLSDLLHSV